MAAVPSLARFCVPSSELQIADAWYGETALDDLLGVSDEKINDDRLYRALDALLPHKDNLCKHFQKRYGELFGTKFDFLIYDITSTILREPGKPIPRHREAIAETEERKDKETATLSRFITRLEAGLDKLKHQAEQGRLRDRQKTERRIGRLLERNSNKLKATGLNWPNYGNRPYAFIRNMVQFKNHRPYRSPENISGNAGCNLGGSGFTCSHRNMPTTAGDTSATYTPGGVY